MTHTKTLAPKTYMFCVCAQTPISGPTNPQSAAPFGVAARFATSRVLRPASALLWVFPTPMSPRIRPQNRVF